MPCLWHNMILQLAFNYTPGLCRDRCSIPSPQQHYRSYRESGLTELKLVTADQSRKTTHSLGSCTPNLQNVYARVKNLWGTLGGECFRREKLLYIFKSVIQFTSINMKRRRKAGITILLLLKNSSSVTTFCMVFIQLIGHFLPLFHLFLKWVYQTVN